MLIRSRRRALTDLQDGHSIILALVGVIASSPSSATRRDFHTCMRYQTELRTRPVYNLDLTREKSSAIREPTSWSSSPPFVLKCSFTKPEINEMNVSDASGKDAMEEAQELLESIRVANLQYPHRSAMDLLNQLPPFNQNRSSHPQQSTAPPTPPPPISFLSQPRSPNPNVINALLLQAVVVGAGALGLLRRRKKESNNETMMESGKNGELQDETTSKEREITATNLVMSSWVTTVDGKIEAKATLDSLKAIHSIKKQLEFIEFLQLQPNRWTIMAIVAFIKPRFTTVQEKMEGNLSVISKATEVRPVLALWIWRAYSEIRSQEASSLDNEKIDEAILKQFILFLFDHQIQFDQEVVEELLEGMYHLISRQSRPSSSMYLDLAKVSLSMDLWSIPKRLLNKSNPKEHSLSPTYRLRLCTEVLKTLAGNKDYNGSGNACKQVGLAILEAVQELSSLNECFRGLKKKRIQKCQGLSSLNSFHYREVRGIEESMTIMMTAMGGKVALQSIMVKAVLVILNHSSTSFSDLFILSFMNWLVDTRNSKFALSIFNAILPDNQTLAHYNILLRSSYAPVSAQIWNQLLSSKLTITVDSFRARLLSHSHRSNLLVEEARNDLRRMDQMGLVRTPEIWNLVLQLVGRSGSHRAFLRQWKRMVSAKVDLNEKTFNILLSNQASTNSHGVKQIRSLTSGITKLERREIGRNGLNAIKATPITQNIIVAAMIRWTYDINSTILVELTKRLLSIDLIDLEDESIKFRWNVTPSKEQWLTVRRPLYNLLAKGFSSRGDFDRFRALIVERGAEKERVYDGSPVRELEMQMETETEVVALEGQTEEI